MSCVYWSREWMRKDIVLMYETAEKDKNMAVIIIKTNNNINCTFWHELLCSFYYLRDFFSWLIMVTNENIVIGACTCYTECNCHYFLILFMTVSCKTWNCGGLGSDGEVYGAVYIQVSTSWTRGSLLLADRTSSQHARESRVHSWLVRDYVVRDLSRYIFSCRIISIKERVNTESTKNPSPCLLSHRVLLDILNSDWRAW